MSFPTQRPRRLRRTPTLRRLVRETSLSPDNFIYPIFVSEVIDEAVPIASMPGIFNFPIPAAVTEAKRAHELGIPAVILFGTPSKKDASGSSSLKNDGIIQRAIREIKAGVPDLLVVTDVCLCEYTDHGHCGVIRDGMVKNDETLEILAAQAVSHAEAGADMVAPSDMMDGRVGRIRRALDNSGHGMTPIMAYSAKYASAFYGPFREAAGSTPQFGDRRSYQMDAANSQEALREVMLDIAEGADIVMVKPALAYLDIIKEVRQKVHLPVAAYNVSGEYTMVKLAAERGIADERVLTMEILTAIKRAGADIILSYHAPQVARWLGM